MKTNKQFMILSALGIIMVLDDHTGSTLGLLTNIFPYNSFYMPMFVFISGYFFKIENTKNLCHFIVRKIKAFLLPYFLYNLLFAYICMKAKHFVKGALWPIVPLKDFMKSCFTWGTPVDVCSSGWFVIMLFHVVIIYAIFRKVFGNLWQDAVALVLFALCGSYTVFICHNYIFPDSFLLVIKVAFFIQFYHLGVCYKKIESQIEHLPLWLIFIITISINIGLLKTYGSNICFNSCSGMRGFLTDNYFLPFLSSITGIAFWVCISKKLEPILRDNIFCNCISNSTFFIMMNHLFFYNGK